MKVGTQPKVEETPIPFTTRYEKDDEAPKGKETEVTPGVNGKTVTTTTYEVDPNTGKVTENPSTSVTTDPVTRVVKVGTQPKVEETPIPFTTRYVEDNTKDKDYREIIQVGVKGKETTTTTYTINPDNGTVIENTPTVVREETKEEIITVGTKPKDNVDKPNGDTDKPKTEVTITENDSRVNNDNKNTIHKKDELPKTNASFFSSLGLLAGFGLLRRKKDK